MSFWMGLFVGFVAGAGLLLALMSRFVRPAADRAVLIHAPAGTRVLLGPGFVPPFHRVELMDLAVAPIRIAFEGAGGLPCRDFIRADLRATCFLKVNRTAEDILRVAQNVGAARASAPETMESLFVPKIRSAFREAALTMEFGEMYLDRLRLLDTVLELVGRDLAGYTLDDITIDHLEQTPLEHLDPNDVSDAQGISKITRMTAEQEQRAAEMKRESDRVIAEQNAEAQAKIAEYERQAKEAEIAMEAEIARARSEIETPPEPEPEKEDGLPAVVAPWEKS